MNVVGLWFVVGVGIGVVVVGIGAAVAPATSSSQKKPARSLCKIIFAGHFHSLGVMSSLRVRLFGDLTCADCGIDLCVAVKSVSELYCEVLLID